MTSKKMTIPSETKPERKQPAADTDKAHAPAPEGESSHMGATEQEVDRTAISHPGAGFQESENKKRQGAG